MKTKRSKLSWLWENMTGYRFMFVIGFFGTVAYNAMQLIVPYFSGKIVDIFLSSEAAIAKINTERDTFYKLIALMIGLTILRVIIVYLVCMDYEHVSQAVLSNIKNKLFQKMQYQDMTFFSTYRTGDLMTRMTGDMDAIRHNIAWVIRAIVEAFSLYTAVAIYFIWLNWKLALSILVISPFIMIIIIFFKKEVAPLHALLREKFSLLNTTAQENISGNKVVKAFAREQYEIDKFDVSNSDYMNTNIKTNLTWIKYFPYVETCANSLPVILLLVGGAFIINGGLTIGEYVSFSGLIWAISNPMRMLGNIMNEFQRFSSASDKVMELYYAEPEIVDAPDAIAHPEPLKGKIEFKHVSFMYGDGTENVLKDVSFTVNPGETVAIMGETGCGKTSLIQMIPRFFEPTSGEVLIDDINVYKYKMTDLRKSIGLASQDVLLHSDTISGNIAYGVSDLSQHEIEKFAHYSAADEFIGNMPQGYDTIIGERGVGLSGGQKQRISLARALAIKPSILILDDTTSAVDMETEKEIQGSLNSLDFPCTKLIIAQRISSTRNADNIIILKDGYILEQGTHDELVAQKGYYYELVRLQENTAGEV